MDISKLRSSGPVVRSVAAFLVALVAGCATTERVVLEPETALAPAHTRFWDEVAGHRGGLDWFHLLNTGSEALEWRLRLIDSARVSIDMETFLWTPDEAGSRLFAHLLQAANRGVRVRFLLDDSFTMHEDMPLHAMDEHPNVELRLYNPFHNRSDSAVLRELFGAGEFARTNHRMHNKVLVVDGRAAIVGGRNLADEYFGLHPEFNFRDMEVLSVGASVPGVTEHFDRFWNSGWAFPVGQVIAAPADSVDVDALNSRFAPIAAVASVEQLSADFRTVAYAAHTGEGIFFFDQPASDNPAEPDELPDQLAAELTALLEMSREEVVLVSAYLVPTPEFEALLERTEDRGVQIRILTNSLRSNNHLAAHSAYRGYIRRFLEHGVDLHEVRAAAADRGLYMSDPVDEKKLGLHAKLLLIDDDVVFVGSCNLDPRSLKINTEVGYIIRSADLNRALREDLAIDFEPRNAWKVELDGDDVIWIGDGEVQRVAPADSPIQWLEDWFIGLLPLDSQM